MKKELDKDYTPKNSSMADTYKELKNLGKQMENLRTNKELKEGNKVPDPIQRKSRG